MQGHREEGAKKELGYQGVGAAQCMKVQSRLSLHSISLSGSTPLECHRPLWAESLCVGLCKLDHSRLHQRKLVYLYLCFPVSLR